MSKKFVFSAKEIVVYPGQGVGTITDITKKEIAGEVIDYYVIYLADSDMTVLVPTTGIDNLGIRRIVTKAEAEAALKFLSEDFEPIPIDWKARYQMNMDLFKSGKILDTASVVRSLYQRSKTKELPIQERKLYDSAYRIFQDEIAASMKMTKTEAEASIHLHLEPLGGPIEKFKDEYDDDDDLIVNDEELDDNDMDEDDIEDSDMYDDE
ncbi:MULTISPECIES: CarD family transcriptional regulator [unclassified Treponema]|uniref:CarD family transcriptional regulator n=1 Tax=unclassified Treponema TaxID=2638727 RepID=UPI0020A5249A|nr:MULTISPECIES: CarD family transcriptional regulator [unclassified Treponema]UTC66067.1 CarD family transcriptional regulator [Treponema sp. OMZ 789]UTC68797.1 CarD family transcriptional regulator [Treponema sp. OMZ 790]UTC71525.1 CarD family transcriptional regulator [Treponema sp. OMZ 791]